MNISSAQALIWVERVTSIAIFLQTLELLLLHKTFSEKGIWSWGILKQEYAAAPWILRLLLNALLQYQSFLLILILRLIAAALIFFTPHFGFLFFLLLSTSLVSIRWRGTFNGGSDFMTIIVLTGLCFAAFFSKNEQAEVASLWYIAIQVCSSYFISGITKIKRQNWRTGKALIGFISDSIYESSSLVLRMNAATLLIVASWLVLIFELSFPLLLLNPSFCVVGIGLACLFHLANFYFFGLNRFVFIWMATYPALYFCSNST